MSYNCRLPQNLRIGGAPWARLGANVNRVVFKLGLVLSQHKSLAKSNLTAGPIFKFCSRLVSSLFCWCVWIYAWISLGIRFENSRILIVIKINNVYKKSQTLNGLRFFYLKLTTFGFIFQNIILGHL